MFGNIASEITGKQVFNPNSAHSIVVEALEKTRSSEALAKRLWMSFVVEGKEALYLEDVQEVLGPARKEEADEAFAALDNDGNADITLDEMIMKVVEIGRDRKSISSSMRDVGQAIGVLDQILLTVLFVIIIFIFGKWHLPFLNSKTNLRQLPSRDTNFVTTLATAGTTLLSLSFVFAATTQEFLGSCIFLFVKHPFDVGDRVDIVGPAQEFLVVEQISLLYTVFKRIDSMKMVQVPNIVLNNLWIENITRSKAMKEQLDMFISFDTSLEDIELLRKEMENFVRGSDNSRDFQPDIVLEATGIGNMDKLQLKVEIRHKSNWHNETVRAARRSKFMCALVLALRKVPIYGPGGGGEPLGGPTNPSYSVAVSNSLAAEARDKAAEAKEGKRLVPTKPAPKTPFGDFGPAGEEKAADAMNTRSPTADAAHDVDKPTWASGEDNSLNSRDESLERQRSNEIDNLKEGLIKRQSTRGRRRPGEAMPAISTQGEPGFTLTAASPNRERYMGSMSPTLDEEAEMGLQSMTSPQGYTAYSGQSQAYSIYPPPSAGSRGAQQPGTSQAGAPPQGRLRRLSLGLKPSNSTRGAGPSQ